MTEGDSFKDLFRSFFYAMVDMWDLLNPFNLLIFFLFRFAEKILIGNITEIRSNDYIREKYAVVESSVDFESLKYVMIITDSSSSVE